MAPIKIKGFKDADSDSGTAVTVYGPFVAYVPLMSLTSCIFWYHKII